MALSQFVSELRSNLSPEARVLTEKSSQDFQIVLLRWSDVDIATPRAIVQVGCELDAVTAVDRRPPAEASLVLMRS